MTLNQEVSQTMPKESPYLRSINVAYDSEHPERLAHFHPTAKCVQLLTRLAGEKADRTFFVVAPYGTGKSLTSAYLVHLVENRPASRPLLKAVKPRLQRVSPALGVFAGRRLKDAKRRGLVLVIEGAVHDVGKAVQSAALTALKRCRLGRQARPIARLAAAGGPGAVEVLIALAEKASVARLDRIVIIWDEFGRHLERLVSAGQAAELADVQQLAEHVARVQSIPVTFGLMMHQGLRSYAGELPESALAEWRKVEGRFTPVQYTDDSAELYELLASIVRTRRPGAPSGAKWASYAATLRRHGLFADIPKEELSRLLASTWPLDPVTFYLLPRLAARAAQNERTMFGFLFSSDLARSIGPQRLWEYFAPVMEADRGIGGTYRTWIETESACAKAENEIEMGVLQLTSLLSLALVDTGQRLTANLLQTASELALGSKKAVATAISALLDRKLLLHRRHVDHVTLWHGTNVDLRVRLQEARSTAAEHLDIVSFLDTEYPAPVWKPTAYNDEFVIRRFYRSRYVPAEALSTKLAELRRQGGLPPASDGEIWYVLSRTPKARAAAVTLAREFTDEPRLLLCLPKIPVNLSEIILDLLGLRRLQLDEDLHSEDPLAGTEIAQIIDDTQIHLGKLVEGLIHPTPDGSIWLHNGCEFRAETPTRLRLILSRITKEAFSATPRLNNEMIVRRQPSAAVVNARKKLCLGILDRYGQERLGIEGEFADAALFRAILLNTGLYRSDPSGHWRFAQPEELEASNQNLRTVWERFRTLLTEPDDRPKNLSVFLQGLQAPPIGLRAGVIPILLAAALKAFPSALSITRRDGGYVSDLLPSEIEALCRAPDQYRLFVPRLSGTVVEYLQRVATLFDPEAARSPDTDFLRLAHDAVEAWYEEQPASAKRSRQVSRETRRFQRALRHIGDPLRLLLQEFPAAAGAKGSDDARVVEVLDRCKSEMERTLVEYQNRVAGVVSRTLAAGAANPDTSLREALRIWSTDVPADLPRKLSNPDLRGLAQTLLLSYDHDVRAIDRIAATCAEHPLTTWDDEQLGEFEDRFPRMVEQIELAALQVNDSTGLVQRRIARSTRALARTLGPRRTADLLMKLANELKSTKEAQNANSARSARKR